MLRKIVLIFLLVFILQGSSFAVDVDYTKQVNECLSILSKKVKDQYGISLTWVSIESNDVDLSVYSGSKPSGFTKKYMSEVLRQNPSTKWCEYTLDKDEVECQEKFSHVFFAKRNNIWTVRISPDVEWEWYWVATEFVTWWWEIGFQFPLKKRDDPQYEDYSYYDEWDDYGKLQKNIVYVQYLADGTLSSCGFIRFNKEWDHSLNDLYQKNYLWNKFEWGSFEFLWDYTKNDDKFRWMKVKIVWLDWDKKNLFNMDVLSISYKNDDSFFSEYIAHKLQIKAMVDVKNMAWTHSMNKVMWKYIDYLINNTCFQIVHKSSEFKVVDPEWSGNTITYKDNTSLPSFCNGSYSAQSDLVSYIHKSFLDRLLSFAIPKVYAYSLDKQTAQKVRKKMEQMPNPEVNWIDIYLWKKIDSLKDETLKWYFIRALVPWAKAQIQYKLNHWESVSYDDIVYYKCKLNHKQIVDTITYLFAKYYKNWELKIPENVKYPYPEFWDCIIPHADIRHKDKFIENSFMENKLKFIKNKFWEKKMKQYEEKIQAIRSKYEKQISLLEKKYNFEKSIKWREKLQEEISSIYKKMWEDIKNIAKKDKDFANYVKLKKEVLKDLPSKPLVKEKNSNKLYYIFIVVWLIFILVALSLIYKKNKND